MTFEKQYKALLQEAMTHGVFRNDRTGVGCYSSFNKSLKWSIKETFPMVTSKKIFRKIFNTEFEWFVNGETNIKRFQDNGVKIWDEWCDDEGELGPVYGFQMVNFNNQQVNQLESVIDSLKQSPDSRRHIISLWNPAQVNEMALPPCYLYFQFFVDGDNLNMFVLQRSADLFLGMPYDACVFSRLLLYVAERANLSADKVEVSIIDAHVYSNHFAQCEQYISNPELDLPTYTHKDGQLEIHNYKSSKKIAADIAV